MGTFRVSVEIGDPAGERFEPVEALVDTGAGYTVVPRSILESLRCQPVLMGPPGGHVLLGVTTLEELGLGIDPLNRRLTPVDLYLA